ncbi:MAG: dihydrodipicolinate synthase family protein [Mangrovibacterium sp.]
MEPIFKGIIPPVVTPLRSNNELDEEGLERLIEHLIAGGVHGLFMLGTTGEAPSLTYTLRKKLLKKTAEIVRNRVPVVAGITDTCLENSLEMAACAADNGLDAVVVAPPYYMPISQEEMVAFLEKLTPGLPLPFLMYDMPGCTKLHMTIDTVKRARDLGAIGVKDSSGDLSYLYALIRAFSDQSEFCIIAGTELYLPETILQGGHGAVAGGANLFPKLFVDLYRASAHRNLERIAVLRDLVMQLNNTVYQVGNSYSRIVRGIKCGLSLMHICSEEMALPLFSFSREERAVIEEHIQELSQRITS